MSFSSAILGQTVFGNKRVVYGTYNCSAVTGGDIETDLVTVEFIKLQSGGTTVKTNAPVVNEILPLTNAGGKVTIVTDSGETGYWQAFGT